MTIRSVTHRSTTRADGFIFFLTKKLKFSVCQLSEEYFCVLYSFRKNEIFAMCCAKKFLVG